MHRNTMSRHRGSSEAAALPFASPGLKIARRKNNPT